ncbi:pisatin demethylase [Lepidopterella palustris CBS 459.81]|uniref:Pisatin demethylase n=1 Tax=Lepidopterella palustris CBS 459.81 TaxID=1314670 RepID=A0A8E2E758_9PEZI|nr:pisatin demethylase [Lepidopterella palustris CBS 459.81]
MLLDEIHTCLTRFWPLVLISSILAYLLSNKYSRGLSKYPGHWLAAYTNWWRLLDVLGWKHEWTTLRLHRKYGDIVRLGPNVLSFGDPKSIKAIYGLNKGMNKSDFYPVQQAVANGRRLQSLFSTTDEDYHARYRRCINSAFAMSSLVSYEPLVDSAMNVFLDQTQRLFADTGNSCNFNQWLQFFAADVIGHLTWSRRLGFMEKNEDVDGIIRFLGRFLSYAGPIGQMPILDLFLEKNPIKLLLQRWGITKSVFPVTQFAQSRSNERAAEMAKIKAYGLQDSDNSKGIDLISKFTKAAHDHPEFMTDTQVLTACISMVFAGSETTAISLSSIFYFLLKHHRVYKKLMSELDESIRNGSILARDNGSVSWAESQKLPYLDAAIQESFRLHPAVGLILERVVPPQGMDICGHFIPGNTVVGCNAWVLHRRPEIFGADVDDFRPERWIEAEPEKLREMKATMFQFGAGSRTCIGKNISLLEVYKLVPSFLRRFEIQLEYPDREWKTHNAWFVRQLDFNTKFKPRMANATVS